MARGTMAATMTRGTMTRGTTLRQEESGTDLVLQLLFTGRHAEGLVQFGLQHRNLSNKGSPTVQSVLFYTLILF